MLSTMIENKTLENEDHLTRAPHDRVCAATASSQQVFLMFCSSWNKTAVFVFFLTYVTPQNGQA